MTRLGRRDRGRGRAAYRRARELVAALGDDVFSVDGRAMEEIVGDLLRGRGLTIAVAESCTGGLLLSRLTDVRREFRLRAGRRRGIQQRAKTALAGVPPT